MSSSGHKACLLAISIGILLLSSCTPETSQPTPGSTSTPASASQPLTVSPQTESASTETVTSSTGATFTPTTASLEPTASSNEVPTSNGTDWMQAPIMPEVSQHVLEIYQDGQAQGRNPHNFSVIGDCQAIPYVFLGPFGRGELTPDSSESYLWDALNQFKDSFDRWSVTARGGFTAASILNPIQADPNYCKSGETPLSCEYRLNNPAFAFITLETWLEPKTIDRYQTYLRTILDYVIERGTVPILLTKADSADAFDGKYVINPAIVQLAQEYDVPLVNFWLAAQYLPNGGLDPTREGFHLSQDGYKLKNILALRALYTVWKAVDTGDTGATGSPTATPTPQATPTTQSGPQVTVPACEGGCIFFATAAAQDGVVTPRGVYAYNYASKKLSSVLGKGFDLQDVSEDGHRLLVNEANRLYEIDLVNASAKLVSDTFFSLGKQDAYWNSDDSKIVSIDQNDPYQTETGSAFNLFPSPRDDAQYFESGTCSAKDDCQSGGVYRLGADQTISPMDSFSQPIFSPDGKWVAYLNPAAATSDNYYHISYFLLEDTERGIASRRVIYLPEVSFFPDEKNFMVYPNVQGYAFSPDGSKLFVLDDVYSAYFEQSLHIETYMLDINSGILYDYGKIKGQSGSLKPRMVWSPEGDKILFFLTNPTDDNKFSLGLFQTTLNTEERLSSYDDGILTSGDYFYVTNLYWR